MNYYNEFDPFAAEWLRQLIKDGLIPNGHVDDRSILEVTPDDLEGYTQHHFFAGIGGWSHALQLAGWSTDRPVCTASLPCQPFSVAGAGKGKDDERHLLPHFMRLVREYGKFDTIMGEQVEGAVRHGWLDDLQATMEGEGYTTGAVVLGAHSVNASHKRQRLYWIAESLANSGNKGLQRHRRLEQVDDQEGWQESLRHSAKGGIDNSTMGNTERGRRIQGASERRSGQGREQGEQAGCEVRQDVGDRGALHGGFNHTGLVYCKDGKYRPAPTEPALFPLAHGIPNRMGLLRGAGNAIVPQAAAQVIRAFMDES